MSVDNNIPNGWMETTLGDVCDVQSGGTPSTKNNAFWNGNIGWITPKDLSNYKKVFIKKGERNITQIGLDNSSAKLLPKHTILFSSRAPIGYVVIAENEITTNQGFKNLICDEINSHYKYFYYLLKLKANHIEKLSSGSTFSEASASLMKSIEINIPKDIYEQKAIAKILTTFDDKIENLQAQNKTLETTAQTIFKEWFGKYQIDNELPDGWRVGKLSESGAIICGKTPSKSQKDFYCDEIPFIKIPDMHNQVFIINTTDNLSLMGANSQKNKTIPANSICVSCIATVGLVSITTKDSQTNQQINSIVLKDNFVREFLFLSISNMHNYLNDLGSGGTATLNVNTTTFSNIELVIPDRNTLKTFHKVQLPLFEKILSNEIQIQTLQQTRDTLILKLMRGQLRVNDFKK